MQAVVTTGIGGYERLEHRSVPTPTPAEGEVLVQVLAAGVNNTDINTRVGWYAAEVTSGTAATALAPGADPPSRSAGWKGVTPFPLIQGTDCCGRVISVASGGDAELVGSRVLVRPCMRPRDASVMDSVWMGSDFDGAFAQFVRVPAAEVFAVQCDWSDAELGSVPCAYGTAENQLLRSRLASGERVLIAGASGGVGAAAVQLAKRRGAVVTAIGATSKLQALLALGADRALDRDIDPLAALGENAVDLVIDNVAGQGFPGLLRVLRRGGRYVSSGAIASPLVHLDMRTVYLKDLTLMGCTTWDEAVFPNLVSYIVRNEIRPWVAKTFPLVQIEAAQREFLAKRQVGKIVLIPPGISP